jgi:protein SCO1
VQSQKNGNAIFYIIAGVTLVALVFTGVFLLLDDDEQAVEATPTAAAGVDDGGGTVVDPPQALPDFTMTANNGEPLSLGDLAGDYVLAYFGYTHCPDVCPATLLDFRQVKRELGEAAEGVTFLFISVDPERDTPDLLDRYLERYDPDFIGLSDAGALAEISEAFGLTYIKRENTGSAAGYLMDHTATKFLIDPQGRLVRVYSFTADPDVIAADLRGLMG